MTVENMECLDKYVNFFQLNSFSCQSIGEYDHTMSAHCKLFMLAMNREQSLYVMSLHSKNEKEHANTFTNLAMTQMKICLKQASAYFCFNKYDQAIDHIITAWQLPVSLKGTMLESLPKLLTDSSYTLLLFTSLFVRKGSKI